MDRNEFLEQQLNLLQDKRDNSNLDWQDINDFRVDSLNIVEAVDTTRKGAKLLNEYLDAGWSLASPKKNDVNFVNDSIQQLRKERMKLQSEKIELNRNLREVARDELITEHIINAIYSLKPLEKINYIEPEYNKRSYLLCLADSHYAIEFQVKDIFGEIVNEYSPEIFKQRMELLFSKLIDTIRHENIDEIHVWELGDSINGLLRVNSQLMQLRYGVVESAILYAEYLANWLNELSKYVRIRYQAVADSNHSQLRLLGLPKNSFPDENMEKVITSFLKERLKDNLNIKIIENPTGMNYSQLSCYSVLGIHGEKKNMAKAINNYSRSYGIHLDYLVAGHKHHSISEETGIDSEVLNVRSIMGVDPYGMSLQKTSNAGASMFVFEQGNGKIMEYTYKLN